MLLLVLLVLPSLPPSLSHPLIRTLRQSPPVHQVHAANPYPCCVRLVRATSRLRVRTPHPKHRIGFARKKKAQGLSMSNERNDASAPPPAQASLAGATSSPCTFLRVTGWVICGCPPPLGCPCLTHRHDPDSLLIGLGLPPQSRRHLSSRPSTDQPPT
ncbi:uncharacterized protein BJ171DRAFT_198713 [Polychytrium aggregatum]|uniref:uncharacterized protein n=1 Tax=Polychytrium aggregatum TaxID=110093 RepID=UPI0022FDF982|nr:uncharacterized protein BJ171DRAFT_198713 [Polychytrium aggregatum]KAI9199783.1 hypothetical protein BJ171DRAFT_198713 [Polychytrium aggregatum]